MRKNIKNIRSKIMQVRGWDESLYAFCFFNYLRKDTYLHENLQSDRWLSDF